MSMSIFMAKPMTLLGLVTWVLLLTSTAANPVQVSKRDAQNLASATQSPPTAEPVCASISDASDEQSFSLSDGNFAIDQFCGSTQYYNTMLTPMISFGTGETAQGNPKALAVNNMPDINQNPQNDIWLQLGFADNDCVGSFRFGIGITDDDRKQHCVDGFAQILSKCDNATEDTPRFGGTLIDQCAEYKIIKSATQPDFLTPKPSGDLSCQDVDTSAIGGDDSILSGKCICKYANYNATDVFEKTKPDCTDLTLKDLQLVIN